MNTGVENARVRSDLLERATVSYWQTLEAHLTAALTNARTRDEISSSVVVAELAKGIVAGVMGVLVQNRNQRSGHGGRDLVNLLINHLNSLGDV